MDKMTKEEFNYLSGLAHISFADQEEIKTMKQVDEVFNFINKLNDFDDSGIKPIFNVATVKNIFRQDKVEESYNRNAILSNAPLKQDGCFKVPNIMD